MGGSWYRYQTGTRISDPEVSKLIERARDDRGGHGRSLVPEEVRNWALAAIIDEALLVLEDKVAASASDIAIGGTSAIGEEDRLGALGGAS